MSTKRSLTEAEREQRRAQQRERLKQSAEQLLTSDGWQRWVQIRSRHGLARLSLTNQLLVALAHPTATFVAGFKGWLRLGYCVTRGQKAIHIIAPMPVKRRDRDTGEQTDETITLFKTVPVFAQDQVAPLPDVEPTPLQPPSQPLTGDSHGHLIAPTIAFAESLGYTVSFESIAGSAGGWCDTKAKRIVVDADGPANARLRTLVHETIHALGVDCHRYPRAHGEVIVDTTTLVVLGGLGLDVSGETLPYVAGWGEDGALEAVTAHAKTIDELARTLEDALQRPASTYQPSDRGRRTTRRCSLRTTSTRRAFGSHCAAPLIALTMPATPTSAPAPKVRSSAHPTTGPSRGPDIGWDDSTDVRSRACESTMTP
jgi:hypothetical protein